MDSFIPEIPSPVQHNGIPSVSPPPQAEGTLQQYYQHQASKQFTPPTPKLPLLTRAQYISPTTTPGMASLTLAMSVSLHIRATQQTSPKFHPASASGHPSYQLTGSCQPSSSSLQLSSKRKEMSSAPSDPQRSKRQNLVGPRPVYLPFQGDRDSAVRQTPKIRIYESLAKDINNRFPNIQIYSTQIKSKIAKMKAQFEIADTKRNESGFGSTDEDQ
ncbi:hypothetical protein BC939DRAFT_521252 [Gamsiella multidivaricata]|uniref:uncharacterized protein n=1 Tax=Gamsiella multidivaricata TaxID=101098 RepID=UPI00221FA8AE|nr:uncharacterized protein BC939DRAFT_521252 [Gamsiella multidivaricata]KAI7818985.1 hypothetical protein BC939DRAFT_521252 [Gamsiella multidivaricata]